MGIFDLAGDLFSGDIASLGLDLLGTSAINPYAEMTSTPSAYTTSFLPTYSFPSAAPPAPAYPVAASVPLAARAVMAGLPRWSAMFPQLWQAIQTRLPMLSSSRAVAFLISALRKYGPGVITGFIGAAALNELLGFMATHKRRRMNVANTRALRRSMRRLKGFHRLAGRVEQQLARSGSRRRRSTRCGTCRKSPCVC